MLPRAVTNGRAAEALAILGSGAERLRVKLHVAYEEWATTPPTSAEQVQARQLQVLANISRSAETTLALCRIGYKEKAAINLIARSMVPASDGEPD